MSTKHKSKIIFSWLLPVKDEADSLPQLIKEINQAMKNQNYEIIAVDDASQDVSLQTLKKLQKSSKNLKVFHFPKQLGKWAALNYGFNQSMGSLIITLDSDLQDNPAEVEMLLKVLVDNQCDLVSGWRIKRQDPFYKVFISQMGNNLVSKLTGKSFKDLNSPLKIYKREIFESLPRSGALLRFSLLFAQKLSYKFIEIKVQHRPRIYGHSKFGLVKYLRIIYDLILIQLLFSGSGSLKR